MALIWLAMNSDGSEVISSNPEGFIRFSPKKYRENKWGPEGNKVFSFDDAQREHDHWIEYHNPETSSKTGELPHRLYLPKGTIKKILGYDLTWEDEPVKLED